MKKLLLFLLGIFTLLIANSWPAYADTISDTPLRIGLNPFIGTGLFYIAKDKGFFDAEKVNVKLVKYNKNAAVVQLFKSGHVDVTPSTPETVVVLSDAGVKVKVVGMLDSSKGADGIIATKEITEVSDLKGKKVAFEKGSSSHLLLSYFLHQKGLTTKDLIVENLSATDAGAAFVAGKVDAAVTWEPWLSKAKKRAGGHLLIDSNSLVFPDLYMIRAAVVQQRPDDVKAMLRALFMARKFVSEHPDESAKIIAKNLGITKSEAAAEMKLVEWSDYSQNMKFFNSTPSQAQKLLQETSDLWLQLGLIKHGIQAGNIVDPALLKNLE